MKVDPKYKINAIAISGSKHAKVPFKAPLCLREATFPKKMV